MKKNLISSLIANCVVLAGPSHLSYPFIFEHQGQIYVILETEKKRTADLDRSTGSRIL